MSNFKERFSNACSVAELEFLAVQLSNSEILANLDEVLGNLHNDQRKDLSNLLQKYKQVCSNKPGRTSVAVHDVDVGHSRRIKQAPYRLNHDKLSKVREEVKFMIEHDIIEPSQSSPIVMVPKPDGTLVVKRGLESLTTGFVFGLWDELMVKERKVMSTRNVIEKMREIVCEYFVYEKSRKAFENRVLRIIAARKRQKVHVSKEQAVKLMEKCFCECERLHTENVHVDGNVDEAGTSEMTQSDEIKSLKMNVLERKCEENGAIKDALREVCEEKKM